MVEKDIDYYIGLTQVQQNIINYLLDRMAKIEAARSIKVRIPESIIIDDDD